MEKYILFGGRKVPINTSYPVYVFENETAPSFYHPEKTLSPDRLMQMSLLRPELRTYSYRYGRHQNFNRTPDQLFSTTREELDDLGLFIHQIALHHDVTTCAKDTFNVLCTRGLSTHFVVNYDGALYQFMDCYHVAWATGDNNTHSIAIDMNNPVYIDTKDDPAAGLRDIYQGKINGEVKTMLGYTEAQYETIIALIKAFISPVQVPGEEPWIPLPILAENCFPPISENGEVINRLLRDSVGFKGFLGHYHCSANKWDPGPAFDWMRVLSGIKGKRNSFPMLMEVDGERLNLADVGGDKLDKILREYYRNAEEQADGGWYPVGANQSWHSGIHLTGSEGTPIMNMMEGTIVAVRNIKSVDLGDPSFVLVRHDRDEDDEDGETKTVTWYSLYMHLEHMNQKEQLEAIPWAAELLDFNFEVPDSVAYNMNVDVNYERGLPHVVDGTVKSKNYDEVIEGFYRGDIVLVDIPCAAGTIIGTMGRFGVKPDRLQRLTHIEVFSADNIFERGNTQGDGGWNTIEGSTNEESMVRIKRIISPIGEYVKSQTGEVPNLLKTSEIRSFYMQNDEDFMSSRRDNFRTMICSHCSEWSPKMNWTRTSVQSVGWHWENAVDFGKWLLLWLPFQWMTDEVTSALEFPENHTFFTYHPIYLLHQLNLTYAGTMTQNAEEAGDSEFKKNSRELRDRLNELKKLKEKIENKEKLTDEERERYEALYQLMDDHLDDQRSDISSETKYLYNYDPAFDSWEPGEWEPPSKVKL